MPIINNLLPDFSPDVTIALWRIEESEEQLLELCRDAGIDTDSLLADLSNPKRRIERTAEHLLLHSMIGPDYILEHNGDGMPLLCHSDLIISISHTIGFVVVALSKKVIGIDIEICQPKILKVRSRFLSDSEQAAIPCHNLQANTVAWTAKEALYKAIGVSGIDFANDEIIDAAGLINSPEHYTCRFCQRTFTAQSLANEHFAFTLVTENIK